MALRARCRGVCLPRAAQQRAASPRLAVYASMYMRMRARIARNPSAQRLLGITAYTGWGGERFNVFVGGRLPCGLAAGDTPPPPPRHPAAAAATPPAARRLPTEQHHFPSYTPHRHLPRYGCYHLPLPYWRTWHCTRATALPTCTCGTALFLPVPCLPVPLPATLACAFYRLHTCLPTFSQRYTAHLLYYALTGLFRSNASVMVYSFVWVPVNRGPLPTPDGGSTGGFPCRYLLYVNGGPGRRLHVARRANTGRAAYRGAYLPGRGYLVLTAWLDHRTRTDAPRLPVLYHLPTSLVSWIPTVRTSYLATLVKHISSPPAWPHPTADPFTCYPRHHHHPTTHARIPCSLCNVTRRGRRIPPLPTCYLAI